MATKPVRGYEGFYEVSSFGKVFSMDRSVRIPNGKILHFKGREIKSSISTSGYLVVGLHKDGKQHMRYIHRLVAEAFIPNIDNYDQVNHKNEVKTDNRVDNLEWCNGKYNSNYGTGKERARAKRGNPVCCYKDNILIHSFKSETEAARKFMVSVTSISAALRKGEPYTCRGYYWKYNQ